MVGTWNYAIHAKCKHTRIVAITMNTGWIGTIDIIDCHAHRYTTEITTERVLVLYVDIVYYII